MFFKILISSIKSDKCSLIEFGLLLPQNIATGKTSDFGLSETRAKIGHKNIFELLKSGIPSIFILICKLFV